MEDTLLGKPSSTPAIQHHKAIAPVLSIGSARSALLWFGLTFFSAGR